LFKKFLPRINLPTTWGTRKNHFRPWKRLLRGTLMNMNFKILSMRCTKLARMTCGAENHNTWKATPRDRWNLFFPFSYKKSWNLKISNIFFFLQVKPKLSIFHVWKVKIGSTEIFFFRNANQTSFWCFFFANIHSWFLLPKKFTEVSVLQPEVMGFLGKLLNPWIFAT
jgi:hypothetical protein